MTRFIATLRHAQSAGKQSGQLDYDRSLNNDGQLQARSIGQKIKEQKINFQLIVSSSSTRTQQTVELLNETLLIAPENIRFDNELYEASMAQWLDQVHNLPDTVESVLLVGHNPCLSILASTFAGSIREPGPCELIGFEFECSNWKQLRKAGKEILNIK